MKNLFLMTVVVGSLSACDKLNDSEATAHSAYEAFAMPCDRSTFQVQQSLTTDTASITVTCKVKK